MAKSNWAEQVAVAVEWRERWFQEEARIDVWAEWPRWEDRFTAPIEPAPYDKHGHPDGEYNLPDGLQFVVGQPYRL